MRRQLAILTLATVVATNAMGQLPTERNPATLVTSSERLVEEGLAADAARLASKAVELITPADDSEVLKRALFVVGRSNWELAARDSANHAQYAARSIAAYERLLALEPNNAAILNNLGRVFAGSDPEKAIGLYRRAIAIGGELTPLYLANMGAVLAKSGRADEAIATYERVLKLRPDDRASEDALLRLYSFQRALQYLWRLVDAGSIERAQTLAFDRLSIPGTEPEKRNLLVVVAVSLARQRINAREFARHPAAPRLASLTNDPDIGAGARELLHLIEGSSLQPSAYQWWRKRWSVSSPAFDCVDAFAFVARELANQQSKSAPGEKAETYLRLALDVSGGLDPDVVLGLTDLYYRTGRTNEIRKLTPDLERLFSEKSEARSRGDWQTAYRYHVALGNIYARLGRTGDSSNPQSAVFQLEHARNAAERYNQTQSAEKRIVVDPNVINLLAESYAKSPSSSTRAKTTELRLSAAQEYVTAGRSGSAQRVLQPITANPAVLKPSDREKYDRIIKNVPPKIELRRPEAGVGETRVQPVTIPSPATGTAAQPARIDRPEHTAAIGLIPPRAKLEIPKGALIDSARANALAVLVAKYAAASQDGQEKLAKAEFPKLGVTSVRVDRNGKGTLILRDDRKQTLTIPFAVE